MLVEQSPVFEKATDKSIYVSSDEQLRYELEIREKAEMDYHSGLKSQYRAGREKSKDEIIRRMLGFSIPMETITKCVDVSEERVLKTAKGSKQ